MSRRALSFMTMVVLASGLLWPIGDARADSPSDYGYWTKAQTPDSPSPPIPSPPTIPVAPPDAVVPENGLYVALAATTSQPDPNQVPSPAEPAAVSALRFYVEPGSPAILSLTVAEGQDVDGRSEQPHPPYIVDACAVDFQAAQWDAPEGAGRWEAKPTWDCETTSTQSIVEEDGQRLSWDLGTSFEVFEGQIDVVLVPRGIEDPANPTGVRPVPFQLGFEPPDEQALSVEVVDSGEEGEEGFEDFDLGDFSLDDLGGEAFGDLGFGDESLDLDGDLTDADAPTAGGGRTNRPLRPIARAPIPLDSRGDRILAVGLLFLIAAGLWWVGGTPTRAPRLLGSLGGNGTSAPVSIATGGVGRFSRPRIGRPPRL